MPKLNDTHFYIELKYLMSKTVQFLVKIKGGISFLSNLTIIKRRNHPFDLFWSYDETIEQFPTEFIH